MSDMEANKAFVLARHPLAKCVGAGWLSGQVHIICHTPAGVKYLSDSFPKRHDGCDEECNCMPDWEAQGARLAWADVAASLNQNSQSGQSKETV